MGRTLGKRSFRYIGPVIWQEDTGEEILSVHRTCYLAGGHWGDPFGTSDLLSGRRTLGKRSFRYIGPVIRAGTPSQAFLLIHSFKSKTENPLLFCVPICSFLLESLFCQPITGCACIWRECVCVCVCVYVCVCQCVCVCVCSSVCVCARARA